MKIKITVAFSICLLASFGINASNADATATTHIWAPSTDVQAFKLWHVTSDFYIPVKRDAAGNHPATVTNAGLTVGVLPFQKVNAEVGFNHKTGLGPANDYPLYLNFKIGAPENAFFAHSPALAAGAFDICTKSDLTDYIVFYGKVAKSLNAGQTQLGRLSVGYFTGNEKLLLDDTGTKDNSGIMAAWERTMSELSDRLWHCVEIHGHQERIWHL
jgi:hypothetical protein